jgi:copper homeostasis protein
VLTSGHQKTALAGAGSLAKYLVRVSGRLSIMAGGTVRAENVKALVAQSGVTQIHSRATDLDVFR